MVHALAPSCAAGCEPDAFGEYSAVVSVSVWLVVAGVVLGLGLDNRKGLVGIVLLDGGGRAPVSSGYGYGQPEFLPGVPLLGAATLEGTGHVDTHKNGVTGLGEIPDSPTAAGWVPRGAQPSEYPWRCQPTAWCGCSLALYRGRRAGSVACR
jgi:hypothetical protein